MSEPAPPLSRSFRLLLGASGALFVLSLALVLLDVAAGLRLPAPVRPVLPWLLVGSMLAGITLLAGALGTPRRERRD